jgi:hypothetical protein
VFGRTVTGVDVGGNWVRNQSLIEYPDYKGSFRNVTINSGVTGFALDLGIIDDYTKDRNEANSKGSRDKTWGWFTDVYMPRFSAKSPRRTSTLIGRRVCAAGGDSTVKAYPLPHCARRLRAAPATRASPGG